MQNFEKIIPYNLYIIEYLYNSIYENFYQNINISKFLKLTRI